MWFPELYGSTILNHLSVPLTMLQRFKDGWLVGWFPWRHTSTTTILKNTFFFLHIFRLSPFTFPSPAVLRLLTVGWALRLISACQIPQQSQLCCSSCTLRGCQWSHMFSQRRQDLQNTSCWPMLKAVSVRHNTERSLQTEWSIQKRG